MVAGRDVGVMARRVGTNSKWCSCVGVAERVTSREFSRPACIDHPGSGLTVHRPIVKATITGVITLEPRPSKPVKFKYGNRSRPSYYRSHHEPQ